MEAIGTVLLIGMCLYPIYWIYDNATSGGTSEGKVFSLIMAVVIGGGALFLLFSIMASNA